MTPALLQTKLYIPQPPSTIVARTRLIKLLDEGIHQNHKLALASAPAGFGKTTLISEWIQKRNRSIAWLTLDEADNDPSRFWAYFIAALQTIYEGIGENALTALQSRRPPPIETLIADIINEIAACPEPSPGSSGSGFSLVLDDFHVITNHQISDALTFLLNNLPSQMHLFLSCRADPNLPLARLRSRGQLTEIRSADLRFTISEADAFLNDEMGLGLSAKEITSLDERIEGWIAGLQMAALSMRGRKDVSGFIKSFSGSHRFILDYLVEEVLDRQSSEIQEFLLMTSILERMTAPLCNAVTDRNDSQMILTQLEQDNLFLIHLDDQRRWHRYHHLFADLLRSRLEQTQPDLVPVLHCRASEWYENAELVEEAIAHAISGEAFGRAANLVEQNAMQMIVRGKHPTVFGWLEALPDELVLTRPWLCVYHAWMRYWSGRREQVEECLQNAEQALASTILPSDGMKPSVKGPIPTETEKNALSEAEERHITGYIAAMRAQNDLSSEKIPRALEMAQRAVELLSEGDYMRSLSGIALGAAHGSLGDVVAAQQAYAEASASAQKCGYRTLSVSATCYLGMSQAKQALLHDAFGAYREALKLAIGPGGRQLPVAGFPLVKLGDLSREWNDLEAASRDLTKGAEACAQWGQADFLADGYVALMRLQLAQGNLTGALKTLRKVEDLVQRAKIDDFILCWLDECRLRLWLSEGNLGAAVRWAQTSGLSVDGELSYHHDLHHINLARVLVAQGTQQPSGTFLDEALGLLARLFAAAEKAGWIHKEIKILILQALALQAGGDSEGALTALAQALTLAEPGGYVRTFIDEGIPMGKMLRQAVARGIAVGYAGKLLAALEEEDEPRARGTTPSYSLVESLSERELEVLRLLTTHLPSTEIARELVISTNTVRSHIKRIYSKLNVHSRRDAIQRAEELGLL
ncbi:MAG: LuxR C-terminal-related transcriptional regulator [Anaerolineales bacterium]